MADETPIETPDVAERYGAATVPDLQAELGERGLPKSGTKPELVQRLLDHDAEQAAADPDVPPAEDPEQPEAAEAEICAECWPGGWPSPDTANASCFHGVWDRA